MKKIYLMASAMLVGGLAFGQKAQPSTKGYAKHMEQAPVEKTHKSPEVEHNAKVDRGTAFWTEDFSNGTAGQGTNGAWTTAGVDGNIWKHDFFGTSGEWSGTGSNVPGTTTAANGFMLFDADSSNFPVSPNYVDKAGELISPSIDLSAESSVNVIFEQEYRFCCSAAGLEIFLGVSNDGGATWTEFSVDAGVAVNINTTSPDVVNINITSVAANQSNVQLRFRWGGVSHYYWAVDDIMLTPSPDHEVAVVSSGWAAIYDSVPYTMVPDEQDQQFYLFGEISNQGANSEIVTFNGDVSGAATLFNGTTNSSPITLAPGVTTLDYAPLFNSGTTIGSYEISMDFTYADIALDDNLTNNTSDTTPFWVTDNVYGRDIDEYTGSGLWNGEDAATGISNGFTMGPWYSMKTTQTIYSIQTALTASTDPGAIIYAQIYESDAAGFTLVYDGSGGNDERTIVAGDISASPTITEYTININEGFGFQMDAGKDYIVCIGHYGGDAIVLMNGQVETPEQTVFLFDPTDVTWYYMTSVPVVRANFDINSIENYYTGIADESSSVKLGQNVPNPFNETSTITYSIENASNVTLEITDVTGKLIQTISEGNMTAGEHTITLNSSNFAKGLYNYTLKTDGYATTKRMMVTK